MKRKPIDQFEFPDCNVLTLRGELAVQEKIEKPKEEWKDKETGDLCNAWETTREEWKAARGLTFDNGVHRALVENALRQGQAVSASALQDYPELKTDL